MNKIHVTPTTIQKYTPRILDALFSHGRQSTGSLRTRLGIEYTRLLFTLQHLWEEGIVIGEVETGATYWSLPKEQTK